MTDLAFAMSLAIGDITADMTSEQCRAGAARIRDRAADEPDADTANLLTGVADALQRLADERDHSVSGSW